MLRLLSMRRTAGSTLLLPPDPATLLRSFQAPHIGSKATAQKEALTVGARALAKHAPRCSHGWLLSSRPYLPCFLLPLRLRLNFWEIQPRREWERNDGW